jgi:hypothetical protein
MIIIINLMELPIEFDKCLIVKELQLIIDTLSGNMFYTDISLKSLINREKSFLTADYGLALESLNFRTFIATVITEVMMLYLGI